MISWRLQKLDRSLGAATADWDVLNQRLCQGLPVLDSRMIESALKHFGTSNEHLAMASDKDGVQALLVLTRHSTGRWSTFLPLTLQVGPTLVANHVGMDSLLKQLPGLALSLDLLSLDPQFAPARLDGDLRHDAKAHALTMSITLTGAFESYWAARPKSLRHSMNRLLRLVTAQGMATDYRRITQATDVQAALARYADLESRGWKARAGTAVDLDSAQGRMFDQVLRTFAQRGEAEVHELWIQGQLAASRLVISGPQHVVILKSAYDETLKQFAGGRVLLMRVVEAMFLHHAGKTLEFYTSATRDQLRWATQQRLIEHRVHYRGAWVGATVTLKHLVSRWFLRNVDAPPADPASEVRTYTNFSQLPVDVCKLFDQAQTGAIGFGLPWYETLISQVFPNDTGVRVHVLSLAGVPVAALPVRQHVEGGAHRAEALGNYYTVLWSPALSAGVTPQQLALLIKAMLQDSPAPCALSFAPMDRDSEAYMLLRTALHLCGMPPFTYFSFGNWYLPCRDMGWDDYLASRRSKLRNTITRMGRKFEAAQGRLEVVSGDHPALQSAINAYQAVYASSWKKPEPYPGFVPMLIQTSARQGWLRLGIAWQDDKPVAAQAWIVANGRAEIYKVAYDESAKAFSPGSLLSAHMFRHVLERDRVQEVDYLIGDDAYKRQWMSHRRERWGMVAYNTGTWRGALGHFRELAGRLIRHRQRAGTAPDPADLKED